MDAQMIKPPPPRTSGVAGVVFLFCAAAGVAGLGVDVLSDHSVRMSAAMQPGARAVLGVGVAAVLVLAAHALRFALGRSAGGEERGGPRGDNV
jgi:hypothetical protein